MKIISLISLKHLPNIDYDEFIALGGRDWTSIEDGAILIGFFYTEELEILLTLKGIEFRVFSYDLSKFIERETSEFVFYAVCKRFQSLT